MFFRKVIIDFLLSGRDLLFLEVVLVLFRKDLLLSISIAVGFLNSRKKFVPLDI